MNRLDVKRLLMREELLAGTVEDGRASWLVSHFMTPAPDCISGDVTALELIQKFHAKEFRHLLVTDAMGRLIGVISDRDVLRCLGPSSEPRRKVLGEIQASHLMSTDLLTISPDRPFVEAVSLMVDHGIGCLPVLADDKLVGILTNTDLQLVLEGLLQSAHPLASAQSA